MWALLFHGNMNYVDRATPYIVNETKELVISKLENLSFYMV